MKMTPSLGIISFHKSKPGYGDGTFWNSDRQMAVKNDIEAMPDLGRTDGVSRL